MTLSAMPFVKPCPVQGPHRTQVWVRSGLRTGVLEAGKTLFIMEELAGAYRL